MRKTIAALLALAVPLAAQTAPKAPPCPPAAALLQAKPVYGVGTKTIAAACPAFARQVLDWYAAHPTLTAPQLVAALVGSTPAAPAPAPTPAPKPDTQPTPAPSPVPSSGSHEHEPAGYTVIQDIAFTRPPIWPATEQGWVDDCRCASKYFEIIDGNVMRGKFPKDSPGGSAPFHIYRPFSDSERYPNLYLEIVVRHSADFDNVNMSAARPNAGTKFFWPAGDQVDGALTYLGHDGPNMDFTVIQQGAEDRIMRGNLASSLVLNKRGRPVRYELLLKANTNNATANGALDVWIDGVWTHHYTNVRWQMDAARTWKSLAWNPTYGGGTNPVPYFQTQDLLRLRISGSRQ